MLIAYDYSSCKASITNAKHEEDGSNVSKESIISPIIYIHCLLKDSSLLCTSHKITKFETEQSITGYVNTATNDSNYYHITLLIPTIGKIENFQVQGNKKFHIYGLDFVDGTTMCLQINYKRHNVPQLCIIPQSFPNISVRNFLSTAKESNKLQKTVTENLKQEVTYNKIHYNLELPNINVKGNRFIPKNRFNFQPDRGIPENSPLFEQAATLETLLYRWGLRFGNGEFYDDTLYEDDNDRLIDVYAIGRMLLGTFTPCEVMLDGDLVKGYNITEVTNITPSEIRQIEYFLPSNFEIFGNLAGQGKSSAIKGLYGEASKRGLLMIWLKSPNKLKVTTDNNQSFTYIKPLGYLR